MIKTTVIKWTKTVSKKSRKPYSGMNIYCNGQEASDLIRNYIISDKPCMICRFGNNELNTVLAYLDINDKTYKPIKKVKYLMGKIDYIKWNEKIKFKMSNNAGFFPVDGIHLSRFSEMMLDEMKNIDILGSWLQGEERVLASFPQAKLVPLKDLEPYFHKNPWSEALEGKKVLVVHPFEDSIRSQYLNRKNIFSDERILPEFDLLTLKSVQSSRDNKEKFNTWFDALRWMSDEITKTDFDIAIIGAGAYGFPLAAHVKKIGKKAVHLGGATQILFGIRGKRWDQWPFFQSLYNEYWVRPSPSETPEGFKNVENGSYW